MDQADRHPHDCHQHADSRRRVVGNITFCDAADQRSQRVRRTSSGSNEPLGAPPNDSSPTSSGAGGTTPQPLPSQLQALERGRLATELRVLNARYLRSVRARGYFLTEQAALNTMYLVTCGLGPQGHRAGTMDHVVEAGPEGVRRHLRRPHSGPPRPSKQMNAGNTVCRTDPRVGVRYGGGSRRSSSVRWAGRGLVGWFGWGFIRAGAWVLRCRCGSRVGMQDALTLQPAVKGAGGDRSG